MTLGNMRANDLYPNENRFATGFPARFLIVPATCAAAFAAVTDGCT